MHSLDLYLFILLFSSQTHTLWATRRLQHTQCTPKPRQNDVEGHERRVNAAHDAFGTRAKASVRTLHWSLTVYRSKPTCVSSNIQLLNTAERFATVSYRIAIFRAVLYWHHYCYHSLCSHVACSLMLVVYRTTDERVYDGRVFSFNMSALVNHLEQQSTCNRLASYFNIDTLKYRVHTSSCCVYNNSRRRCCCCCCCCCCRRWFQCCLSAPVLCSYSRLESDLL